MRHSLLGISILAALVLPAFVYGRPAIENNGSILSMLAARASKPEDFSNYEQEAISSLVQGRLSIPSKSRQKRQSDQRRAELETLIHLSKITAKRSNKQLDLIKIGRRKRYIMNEIPSELVPIHDTDKLKHDGDPVYPLIS